MTTTAIQAQHARNLLRLARVNAALSAWDEYEPTSSYHPTGGARCPGRS